MVKKLQHHGKHNGKQAVTDAEIDASTEDMHKQDADPKDAEKKGLVDIIEILGHWFKELAEKKKGSPQKQQKCEDYDKSSVKPGR